MSLYAQIKPGGLPFIASRIGGPGLANLLWLWAKMVVAHEITGLPMAWPVWRQIKPRALLRGEFSMGYYPAFFTKSDSYISRLHRHSRQSHISADEALLAGRIDELVADENILEFSCLLDPYEGLFEYKRLVSNAFCEICPARYMPKNSKSVFTIVAHVRRGDFCQLGFESKLDDYLYAISSLVKCAEGLDYRIVVCTDAVSKDEEFWSAMPDEAEIAKGRNALEDLCLMMSADILIGTARSSYSRAAAYLSDMPVFWCGEPEVVSRLSGVSPLAASVYEQKLQGDANALFNHALSSFNLKIASRS